MNHQMKKEIDKLLLDLPITMANGNHIKETLEFLIRQSNLALIDRLEKEEVRVIFPDNSHLNKGFAVPSEALDELKKLIKEEE